MKKYVLDTNILLSSPNSIYGFDDNEVLITQTTLQELDRKKTAPGELGKNARDVIRTIDGLRESNGNLIIGIPLSNGGRFRIISTTDHDLTFLPSDFEKTNPDNRILAAIMKEIRDQRVNIENSSKVEEEPIILVTNDAALRISASVCKIPVESYRNDHVSSQEDYLGRRIVKASNSLIKSIKDSFDGVEYTDNEKPLIENEFVELINENEDRPTLAIYRGGRLYEIPEGQTRSFGVIPKNSAQAFALYALTASVEEIPLVILKGPAGCAKTFLSLAAGLEKVYTGSNEREYDRLLITRNNVTADADFGYLPGDLEEKMSPLLAPFYDNLETLLKMNTKESQEMIQTQIEDMFYTKTIDLCPLAYMRGRSITNSYLIVDEVQNASVTQVRDIVTRAGVGTKVILCGDPNQIDSHVLDKFNNGLIYAATKMKGSPYVAQLTFDIEESVRSDLAAEALRYM